MERLSACAEFSSKYSKFVETEQEYRVTMTLATFADREMMREWIEKNIPNPWSYQLLVHENRCVINDNRRITCEFSFADLQDATLFRLRF